jgi:dephospho-CoA kinase
LTRPGTDLAARIAAEFGSEFVLDSGELDRRKLAASVFGEAEATARLNEITHPPIMAAIRRRLTEAAAEGRTPIACVVAPLLLEAGWGRGRGVDRVLLMVADDGERVSRVVARDGLKPEEVKRRMERQMPAEEQRRHADWIVDTTGEKAAVLRQLEAVWEELNRL